MNRKRLILASILGTIFVIASMIHPIAFGIVIGCACTLAAASAFYVLHKKRPNRWTYRCVGVAKNIVKKSKVAAQIALWKIVQRDAEMPRFLPNCKSIGPTNWRVVYRSTFYELHASDSGLLRWCDGDGLPIVATLEYYSETSHGIQRGLSDAKIEVANTQESVVVVLTGANGNENVTLTLTLSHNSPAIEMECTTVFRQPTVVKRLALIVEGAEAFTEVFTPNGIVAKTPFPQDEYWLGNEGAKFGTGSRACWLYHVPGVSSLQVYVPRNQLWINLDYFMDHPTIRIPFRQDGTARWEDKSRRPCRTGESLRCGFVLHVGAEPKFLPRLLFQPEGKLSTFVWTEHACHTAFPVHRALCFGRSDISKIDDAVGGFCFHHVPITKSVHYSNDTQMTNAGHTIHFAGPMTAITNTEGFGDFLRQVAESGLVEVCLHCRDPQSSSRADNLTALQAMSEDFAAKSWIDHIWCRPDGNVSGSREAFSCEGYVEDSPGYIGDLFERFGVRYFWNNANEYFGSVQEICQNQDFCEAPLPLPILAIDQVGFFSHLVLGKRCGTPLPIAIETPWVTGHAISWPTYQVESGTRPTLEWDLLFAETHLERFAEEGMIYFAHAYPTFAGDNNGGSQTDASGNVRIHPTFDEVLRRMARFADQGKIWLATVRDAIDYWQQRAEVVVFVDANGNVVLRNNGSNVIANFSIALKQRCEIVGANAKWKSCDRGEVCWFDLPAEASISLVVPYESPVRQVA
jgi:hypothetical protein